MFKALERKRKKKNVNKNGKKSLNLKIKTCGFFLLKLRRIYS